MKPIEELTSIFHKLPIEAALDIKNRIADWVVSGGKEDDPYVHQQVRYAKNLIKTLEGGEES